MLNVAKMVIYLAIRLKPILIPQIISFFVLNLPSFEVRLPLRNFPTPCINWFWLYCLCVLIDCISWKLYFSVCYVVLSIREISFCCYIHGRIVCLLASYPWQDTMYRIIEGYYIYLVIGILFYLMVIIQKANDFIYGVYFIKANMMYQSSILFVTLLYFIYCFDMLCTYLA